MRALAENNGGALALAPAPTPPDYSIYDLATAMATARQVRVLCRVSTHRPLVHTYARARAKKKVLSLCLLVKLASFTRSKSQTLRCKRIITAQGDAPLAEPPAKKEVREIEFFPAASAHHRAGGGGGGRVSVPDEPAELAASFSSPYGAASHTAPQLDLSLRL